MFWDHVKKGADCWLWQGEVNRDGYGRFRHGGRTWMAHRWAWQAANGPIPDGRLLMHLCDTPACVRPDHLRVGTQAENVADRHAKGRDARGERCGTAVLTEEQVRGIKASYRPWGRGPNSAPALARKYGVTKHAIYKIVKGKNWRWV